MFVSASEINDGELQAICDKSYCSDDFDDEAFIPVKKLGSAFIAELFHGPTFCFKDLGMRGVINILSHFSFLRKRKVTILVATTGDTGPAAVSAVSDAANPLLSLVVHYPKGQISDFQRRSLTTVESPFVKIVCFEGGGDDMDWPIKQTLLENNDNEGKRTFVGINSYNIGRPLLQMVHFIWIYLRMAEHLGIVPGDKDHTIDMVIPTGAMGNLTGGYMAKQMGIPIGKLCAGVNINDITHRVIESGEFHRKRIKKTLSDAINIEVPYNFERIAYYVTGCNSVLIKGWMTEMESTQQLTIEKEWHEKLKLDFCSARVTDDQLCEALRLVSDKLDYVSDPHTAVAMSAALQLGYEFIEMSLEGMMPVVIVATASPCKFQEQMTVALGVEGWKSWEANKFPAGACKILDANEVEPYYFPQIDGVLLSEVQSKWRQSMLDIVHTHL